MALHLQLSFKVKRQIKLIITSSIIVMAGVSCNSSKVNSNKENESLIVTDNGITPAAIDSVIVADTVLHTSETLIASSVFDWKVQIKNSGGVFEKFDLLKDSSFVASFNYDDVPGILPTAFLDSRGRTVHEGIIKEKGILKVDKNGEKEWLRRYYPEQDFVSLTSYAVTGTDKIVALVFLEDNYFKKLEEERYQAMGESDEEIPIDHETEQEQNNQDRRSFGLEFLNENGDTDSIVIIENLSPDITVLSFKPFLKDKFVIGGMFHQSIIKGDSSSSGVGDFILVVDTHGKIVWSDVVLIKNQEELIPHTLFLDAAADGRIYFSSAHFGEVAFSNGQTIKVKPVLPELNFSTYLVSYSKEGRINWTRNNKNLSYSTAIKAAPDGAYLAQRNYGSTIYNSTVDTSGFITEFLTFFDKKGNAQWSKAYPVNKINSIDIDSKGAPVIMGNYNDRVYDRPLRKLAFEGISLNDAEDLFVFRLDKKGKLNDVWTGNLNIRTDLHATPGRMVLGPDDSCYIICDSENFFEESAFAQNGYFGEISFLGKLKKKVK